MIDPTDLPTHRLKQERQFHLDYGHPGQLPRPLTSFVERDAELAVVVALLRDPNVRLLTLTGPGGVGKTRLALAAVNQSVTDFHDGVTFVGLASIADFQLVIPAIASALGLREMHEIALQQRIIDVLATKHILLLLDNFEHVLKAGPQVHEILGMCPGVTLLSTSRVRLRLTGEREFPVVPLTVPPLPDGSFHEGQELTGGVKLFVQRVQSVVPEFTLTAETLLSVSQIVQRLDGLPLAIELAAARAKALPLAALLERLDQRLPLLSGGARDLPLRQQTMRDTIAWSYDLLSPVDQTLLRRLAVCVGGFTLGAAEAMNSDATVARRDDHSHVSLDTVEGITALVEQSLLRHLGGNEHEPRYQMLETVREFALEELVERGEEFATRRRHAAWCCRLAKEAESHVHGPNQIAWLDHLDSEFGNLSAAMAWAAEADPDLALQLGGALNTFWHVRGHLGFAHDTLTRALEVGGSAGSRAKATLALAWLAYVRSDLGAAATLAIEARSMFHNVGDAAGGLEALQALGLTERGLSATTPGHASDHARRAETAFREELALALDSDSGLFVAYAQQGLGGLAADRGDFDAATAYFTASLEAFEHAADHRSGAWARVDLGRIAIRFGNVVTAARWFTEALALFRDLGDQWSAALVLGDVAELALELGHTSDAARLLGAADGLRAVTGGEPPPPQADQRQRVFTAVLTAVGIGATEAIAAGQRLGLEGAVAEALAITALAQGNAGAQEAPHEMVAANLTPRELAVLRLLAEGLSDREIAEALNISPRTVGGHVTHLLGKLGVSSRSAAAVAAVRLALVRDHPDPR